MKSLPEVKMNKSQEQVIYSKIAKFFDEVLFSYMEEVLKDKRVENEGEGIAAAIKSGRVFYQVGVFKSKSRFSNKLAKELESIGARYSKSAKGYALAPDRVPMNIQQAIAQVKIKNQENVTKIQKYLEDIENQADYIFQNINFDKEVEAIGRNLDYQFRNSMKKINVVPADLTSYQLSEISKNYTTNLNYYIQKWTRSEIVTLREKIQDIVFAGYRAEALEDLIKKRKGVSDRKAKFLARQETKLLVAEYRKNRFKQEGVTTYRWSTVLDGRERELHKQLNGRIFSWDEPPIIDATTGERGNPGEAYNCRCSAIPVITDNWLNK